MLCCGVVSAQKHKVTGDYVAVGHANMLDSYLSPLEYTGTDVRFIAHTDRWNDSTSWQRRILYEGQLQYVKSPTDDGKELGGMFQFSYGVLWRPLQTERWRLAFGPSADLHLGFLYNTRNGNNPAQARAALNISPLFSAAFRASGKVTLNYEASAPLVGVMFSPNYGQSYYEIFTRGNYDHNCVFTTTVSTPSLRQMLTADIRLGRITLSVGYLGDYAQYDVNSLKYHHYTHSFVIGIK